MIVCIMQFFYRIPCLGEVENTRIMERRMSAALSVRNPDIESRIHIDVAHVHTVTTNQSQVSNDVN